LLDVDHETLTFFRRFSGAGMDMSLAIIAHLLGMETASKVANWIEYEWHQDASWDPFAERCVG